MPSFHRSIIHALAHERTLLSINIIILFMHRITSFTTPANVSGCIHANRGKSDSCRRRLDAPASFPARAKRTETSQTSWPKMVFLTTPTVEEAKQALLKRVKDLDLGRRDRSPDSERTIDERFIQVVERLNPTRVPVDSPLLGGRWRLVYTNSRGILGLDRPAIARPSADSVYQTILLERGMVVNEERVLGILSNKVEAVFKAKPPRRVEVQFQRFQFGLLKVPAPSTARGWLDVTFLDDTMRISRGNLSNVFVLVREDRK